MTGFVVTAVIGAAVLLAALVFDGALDVVHIDFTGSGIFSLASIGGLVAGIGLGGMLGISIGLPTVLALLLGLGVGVGIAAVGVLVFKALRKIDVDPRSISPKAIVGTRGVVTSSAKIGQPGLVQVSYLGSPRTMTFTATWDVETGDDVRIAELLSPDSVKIAPD
ncbi:MAG: hypothetical protein LBR21_10690 [Propionibacteriaceae bacterium]|jgi:hypothetical protein|nr:hypothetical protein [Propionibacteriaceae bacterium]